MQLRRSALIATLVALLVVGAGATPAATAAATPAVQSSASGAQVAACEFPVSATDATGTEVTVEDPPERVTTLAPSAAQTMWEIGGESQVVGVTQFAFYLDGADEKANVSAAGGMGASTEKVVDTEPDLVLAPNVTDRETIDKLREAGLTVYVFEMATSIEDVRDKTTRIGELTDNCEDAAETNAWMTANVEAAQEATADAERPRAIYPLGGGYVAGEGTFIHEMIEASGATNVAAEADVVGYQQISDETVVELQPEVVIVTPPGGEEILNEEPYASTPAAENGATLTVNANWLNQPAPRSVVFSVRNLTEGFHPDAYGEAEFVARSEVDVEADASADDDTETPTDDGSPADDGTPADETPTEAADTETPADDPQTPGDETGSEVPGFGVGAAVAALLASAALAARRLR